MIPFCTHPVNICCKVIVFSLFLLLSLSLNAQYNTPQNRIWIFGNQSGFDFTNGYPVAMTSNMNAGNNTGTLEANTSVCDSNGTLLFYTDGSLVRDRLGNPMPNGNDLTGLGAGATNSTSQGALIVPMPDSAQKYYVFSLTAVDQAVAIRGRLYYSIVNMELNGGMGDVEASRKGVFVETGLTEKMIGIKGDRCNIWVLTCVRGQAVYKAYEITAEGFNSNPVLSNTGTPKNLSFGYLAVSPDRKHLACSETSLFSGNNGLELSRFDAASGIVSDPIQLEPNLGYYGISFSPDNSKLYGSSFQDVYQFDITAANPAGTKILISDTGRSTGMELGPDGRIYFQHSATVANRISFITYPNLAGAACAPQLDNILLLQGSSVNFGFHNTVPVLKRDTIYSSQSRVAGCFASDDTLTLPDATGWDYVWNDGSTDARLRVTHSGTYWARYYTAPCVFHIDTFKVSFPNGMLPQITVGNSCKSRDNGKAWVYTFTGDTVVYHYTWTNISQDTLSLSDSLLQVPAGLYNLHIATVHCDTILPVSIPEEEHHVSFLADTLICLGDLLSFQNTSDPHFVQFKWYFGDGDSSLLSSPPHLFLQAGTYHALLTGRGQVCTDTSAQTIIVDAPLTDIKFRKEPESICMGEQVLFSLVADSTLSNLDWIWGDGNGVRAKEYTMAHAYDREGVMPLELTATFRACPALRILDTLSVFPLPLVRLGTDTAICLKGPAITLSNSATEQPGYQYKWNTGAETKSITVLQEGRYNLRVTNAQGCSTSESITVHKDCYIDIPNAFTPNGDGVNDYFFPRQLLSAKLTAFHMKVINRWGQAVFETNRTDGRGWDGRFNGKEQPEGVYLYLIETGITDTLTEQYQGNVTLIR